MELLNDLLISKIRKIVLQAHVEDGNTAKIWATKDRSGNWVIACNACVMIWPEDRVDSKSAKLDNLITEGFDEAFAEAFEEHGAVSALLPDLNKIIAHVAESDILPEEKNAFAPGDVRVFEYNKGWSRTVSKVRVYYKTAYVELAKELIGEVNTRFRIYHYGDFGDGFDRNWLIVYEDKTPVMIIANSVPDRKEPDGTEDAPAAA
jgi:hypothetical protein